MTVEDPMVLARVRLSDKHQPTGRTKHFLGLGSGQVEIPTPVELRITQYAGTDGFYLFYCDDDGTELTDTFHDTASDALDQAEWEFNVAGRMDLGTGHRRWALMTGEPSVGCAAERSTKRACLATRARPAFGDDAK